MKCEFEEKIYEFYHNLELVDRERIIFPPGHGIKSFGEYGGLRRLELFLLV